MPPSETGAAAILMTVEWVDVRADANDRLLLRELRIRKARERIWPHLRDLYSHSRTGRAQPIVLSFLERWFRLAHLSLTDEGRTTMARHRMHVVEAFLRLARAMRSNLGIPTYRRELDIIVTNAVYAYWEFVQESDKLNLEEL